MDIDLVGRVIIGERTLFDFDEFCFWFEKLYLVALEHQDQVITLECDLAEVDAIGGVDGDRCSATLADQHLVARRKFG